MTNKIDWILVNEKERETFMAVIPEGKLYLHRSFSADSESMVLFQQLFN